MDTSQTAFSDAHRTMLRARAQSRLHESSARLREAHVELDSIEARLASLREHQAAFLLTHTPATDTPSPDTNVEQVQTIDLRSPAEADVVSSQLDIATHKPDSVAPSRQHKDDFDARFAAFAAHENDDYSRRWLDG